MSSLLAGMRWNPEVWAWGLRLVAEDHREV